MSFQSGTFPPPVGNFEISMAPPIPSTAKLITPGLWSYSEAFSRNLGLISPEEQERLRRCRVAIPGMGGVGGNHLMTLTRMGIGKFRIADADDFEAKNFNRQFGATVENIGRKKTEVLLNSARSVNPELQIEGFNEFVTEDNVDRFLEGVDLVVDSVDFFAFEARRMLFREARERGIWVVTAGPIGFSSAWLLFDPRGMSFDRYFDVYDGMQPIDFFCSFAVGLVPRATQAPYFDMSYVEADGRGPSVASACRLASGVVGAEAVKILLQRGKCRAAPCYAQFDAYRCLLRKGRIPMGNRNPIQRIKRRVLKHRLQKLGFQT